MIERLLSFADPSGDAYGAIAIVGERGSGLARAGSATEVTAIADTEVTRGEGSISLGGEGRRIVLGLAAQTSPLGFETPEGATISLQAVGVSGDIGAEGAPDGFEGIGVAWSFEGIGEVAAIRTAWAALGDGALLVLFSTRPSGTSDHSSESTGCARIAQDGAVTTYVEPLLSTEYDESGAHTRATLELWGEAEDALPDRGAGNGEWGAEVALGSASLHAARFAWRVGGAPGVGGYEILRA